MSAFDSLCSICGCDDRRMLCFEKLGESVVTLCGSHALAMTRLDPRPTSVAELREATRNRRERRDRRGHADDVSPYGTDPLGASLIEAFAGERRSSDRRS